MLGTTCSATLVFAALAGIKVRIPLPSVGIGFMRILRFSLPEGKLDDEIKYEVTKGFFAKTWRGSSWWRKM